MYTSITDYQTPFEISKSDLNRPWGGFWCIDETQIEKFIDSYFPTKKRELMDQLEIAPISPKILFVQSARRLSWQYHHRRSELWKVVQGPIGIVRSEDDTEWPVEVIESGTLIEFKAGERHRLVGLNHLGIVAELWRHLDPDHPSDEDDIVRLQDDYGR
jgi:mannose-6-phosphate isomerase